MNIGVSYKDFVKNPFVAILFLAVTGLGYLHLDNKKVYVNNIHRLEAEIRTIKVEMKELKDDNEKLHTTIIETLKEINKKDE